MMILAISGLALAVDPQEGSNRVVEAKEIRGKPVKVNGNDMKLWVYVFPAGEPKKPAPEEPAYCTDDDQSDIVPKFANAKTDGLIFHINRNSIPIDKDVATQAIEESFYTWDSVEVTLDYFTVNSNGGATSPSFDGTNTVGWIKIVPRNYLAAAWVWTDANNEVVQADIFFNSLHKWGVFNECNSDYKYEVGNIATHEIGHTVGLDHLIDPNAYATMYPTSSDGEVRKRTLTDGDINGYKEAGGY